MVSGLAPHQVYSEELADAFRRGHPIAVPQPGARDGQVARAVGIGDVGYIHPSGGDFIRLFNVHLEPGIDGQPDLANLPEGFTCLPLRETRKVPNETPVWLSNSVTRKRLGANVSGPLFGGSIEFESSSNRGAILVTPDPIDWVDALHILSYKEYTRSNIESWFRYARSLGHDISFEDIILVTGVDLTTSWATAVFSNTRLEAGFGLEVQFTGTGAGLNLACQYSWHSTSSALVNSGPTPIRSSLTSPMSALSPQVSAGGTPNGLIDTIHSVERRPINTTRNQALFVRHIRGKRRHLWPGMKLKARGELGDTDDEDDTDEEDCDTKMGGTVIVSHPRRRKFTDSLDPVLDFILGRSDADIAIAHDEDLALFPTANLSFNRIIVKQDGVGMFQYDNATSMSPLQPESTHEDSHVSQLSPKTFGHEFRALSNGLAEPFSTGASLTDNTATARSPANAIFPTPRHALPQSERSRRRAPAACTPCRIRHVRCIWSPSDGNPVRCQRCRERELDCVYESTSTTEQLSGPLLPSLVPVSGQNSLGSSLLPPIYGYSPSFSLKPPEQEDNRSWTPRELRSGTPFEHSHSQFQAPSGLHYGSESWRMPGAASLTPSSFHPTYSVPQTNGSSSYKSTSNAPWPNSPNSTIDPHNDPFYDLISQSPVHSNAQSPPMLDPPSRF